jgi:hypothetical protein
MKPRWLLPLPSLDWLKAMFDWVGQVGYWERSWITRAKFTIDAGGAIG